MREPDPSAPREEKSAMAPAPKPKGLHEEGGKKEIPLKGAKAKAAAAALRGISPAGRG